MSDVDALTAATAAVRMVLDETFGVEEQEPSTEGSVEERIAAAALEAVGWSGGLAQPMPLPNDQPSCHDLLGVELEALSRNAFGVRALALGYLIRLNGDRKEFGLRKYGTLLQPFNGRNAINDKLSEFLDALVYDEQNIAEAKAEAEREIVAVSEVNYARRQRDALVDLCVRMVAHYRLWDSNPVVPKSAIAVNVSSIEGEFIDEV